MPYVQENLVSDVALVARNTDSQTLNPWGIVSFRGKLYVAENLTAVVNEFSPQGALLRTLTTSSLPTGLAVNPSTTAFPITNPAVSATASSSAILIVVTQEGLIEGWNPQISATSFIRAPIVSIAGASFTGVTVVEKGVDGSGPLLFVADFGTNSRTVHVFNASWNLVTSFTDPALVAEGYAPFNVGHVMMRFPRNNQLQDQDQDQSEEIEEKEEKHHSHCSPVIFVTFAFGVDELLIPGVGHGYIDVFATSGQLISRYASRGELNAPWGMLLTPTGILVANHGGTGRVLKYTTHSFFSNEVGSTLFRGQFETPIRTTNNGVIENDGLWGLALFHSQLTKKRKEDSKEERARIFFTAGFTDVTNVTTIAVHGLVGEFITVEQDENEESRSSSSEKRIRDPDFIPSIMNVPPLVTLVNSRKKKKKTVKRGKSCNLCVLFF